MCEANDNSRARRDLVSGSLFRNLMRLALPLAAGILLRALYGMVDIFWLGRLGGSDATRALAAPGVVMPFVWFSISFGMGFGTAGTALVAQFTGAGRIREADTAAAQTFGALLAVAVVFGVPMVIFAPQILTLCRVPAETIPVAVPFARILIAGLPAIVISIGFGATLRALGDSLTVVLVEASANVLNMILDPIFIFGWGPIPRMQASGAAIATVISQVIAACVCIYLLHHGRAGLKVSLRDLKPDWPILRRIFSVGLPTAIGNSSSALGYTAFQIVVNGLGEVVISAFTVGFRAMLFLMSPGDAMVMAAAPVVGQTLGAGKPELAERAVILSSKIVAGVLFLPTVLLTWQRHRVAAFFVDDPAVMAEIARFLLVVPASLYLFYVTIVLMAAFFGSGHTKPAMALHIFRLWGLRLPFAIIFTSVIAWGSFGVYGAMVFGNFISAFLAIWLFRRGKWKTAVI